MKESTYHEFTELPAWTQAIWSDSTVVNQDDPYKWGGTNPPPAIGARVHVYMNGIGPGTVTSYFAEHGWLGVLVRPHKAPKWYVKQNGRYKPGHVFGPELEPRTVKQEA